MARRGCRGGGKGPLLGELCRRIVSWEKSLTASVEEIVNHLLSYRDYSNQKLQPFTSQVQNILQQLKHNPQAIEEETPPRKKLNTDSSKRRLQLLEAKHITNRQRNKNDGDGESSTLTSTSESSDSHSSSENTEPSLSSDSIYGEEPDLMRVMLQNSYNQQKNSTPKSKKIESKVIHDNNGEKGEKIHMLKGGQQRRDLPKLGGGDGEIITDSDANGGPTFKDLGGMGAVLEELKIAVIVPLFYPHLIRHLGVRPMTGILFHGPPGCGKTKLAHAIANETRVLVISRNIVEYPEFVYYNTNFNLSSSINKNTMKYIKYPQHKIKMTFPRGVFYFAEIKMKQKIAKSSEFTDFP
ncbi:putative WD repeat-containing protein RUP2-like [Capsicum annuum]|nr:putative WD repeat-containing protein RUP2-like [Capsicum annuum]